MEYLLTGHDYSSCHPTKQSNQEKITLMLLAVKLKYPGFYSLQDSQDLLMLSQGSFFLV